MQFLPNPLESNADVPSPIYTLLLPPFVSMKYVQDSEHRMWRVSEVRLDKDDWFVFIVEDST